HPTYKQGRGPIDIRVIDPLNVKSADFIFAMDSLVAYDMVIGSEAAGENEVTDVTTTNYKAHWRLIDQTNNRVYYSDTTISYKNEQLIPELGIAITIFEPLDPGPYKVGSTAEAEPSPIYGIIAENNGVLES